MDNLDIKAFKKILKRYENDKNIDICHMMANEIEKPKGCCFIFMYCCCFCLLHNVVQDHIIRRSRAIEDLFLKKYPTKKRNELMADLRLAIEVIEKHNINLYDIRNRAEHLHLKYPNINTDEMRVISQAIYLLNPVVFIL